jgi:PTS system glucitol/sorbitol-specific IIA component
MPQGTTYYKTTVVSVGAEATEMAEGGVVILFAEPVPEALADVSVVHRPSHLLSAPIQANDTVDVAGETLTITAVGDIAGDNLEQLGHVVLYIDQPDQKLLPGAVHATGTLTLPKPEQVIEFRSGS